MAPMEGMPVLATVEKGKDLPRSLRGLAGAPPPPTTHTDNALFSGYPSLTLQEP